MQRRPSAVDSVSAKRKIQKPKPKADPRTAPKKKWTPKAEIRSNQIFFLVSIGFGMNGQLSPRLGIWGEIVSHFGPSRE